VTQIFHNGGHRKTYKALWVNVFLSLIDQYFSQDTGGHVQQYHVFP
jgi:hypothetical protein